MDNTLALYREASNRLGELDIPSKEMVQAWTNNAFQLALLELENNNLSGAKHVVDQLAAVEHFLRSKVRQKRLDASTMNVAAAGKYRVIREIGRWGIENIDHNSHASWKERLAHSDARVSDRELYKVVEVLTELGISNSLFYNWMDVGFVDQEKFENWLTQFLVNDLKQETPELIWNKVWDFAKPPSTNGKAKSTITLQPHMKAVYEATNTLKSALVHMQAEIAKGDTPPAQVTFVLDQLISLVEDIRKTMKQVGELY